MCKNMCGFVYRQAFRRVCHLQAGSISMKPQSTDIFDMVPFSPGTPLVPTQASNGCPPPPPTSLPPDISEWSLHPFLIGRLIDCLSVNAEQARLRVQPVVIEGLRLCKRPSLRAGVMFICCVCVCVCRERPVWCRAI